MKVSVVLRKAESADNILALDLTTGEKVALKLESIEQVEESLLENEIMIYEELAGNPGIPRVYWHGGESEYRGMAFELLGPTLEDLFGYCDRQFSLKTVLMLADELIGRFQCIHSKGFLHRDIKPANLLMGRGERGNTIYLTDWGVSTEFDNNRTGPPRQNLQFFGTTTFASINAHKGVCKYAGP
jgi:serine/threonine protein kinase